VFPANHVKKPVALNYCGELKARGGYAAYDVDLGIEVKVGNTVNNTKSADSETAAYFSAS
jgi:hypothetical protein